MKIWSRWEWWYCKYHATADHFNPDPRRNAKSDTFECWSQCVYANRLLHGRAELNRWWTERPPVLTLVVFIFIITSFRNFWCIFFNLSFQMQLKSVVNKHIKIIYYFWWCTAPPRWWWWWRRYMLWCNNIKRTISSHIQNIYSPSIMIMCSQKVNARGAIGMSSEISSNIEILVNQLPHGMSASEISRSPCHIIELNKNAGMEKNWKLLKSI